jgi:hypothetical protein
MGIGCASVLKTHVSSEITSSSLKIKYRYLSVSAKKNVCNATRVRTDGKINKKIRLIGWRWMKGNE